MRRIGRSQRQPFAALGRALIALVVLGGIVTATPRQSAAASQESYGLTTTKQVKVGARLTDYTFATKAAPWPTHVRVLLPENYDPSGRTRYPVLYLLHGGGGDHTDWTLQGDAVNATKDYPYIVVMGECHQFGNYSDWWNWGRPGAPKWETYFIDQLLPWIDAHYPTRGDRFHRAIAGLSMGGGGAAGLAAHHPDLFSAVGVFSGAVDTNQLPVQALVEASSLQMGLPPGAVFGHRATDEVRWRGSNPWDLALNLQHMALDLTTGNGYPGGPGRDTGDPVEAAVQQMMTTFHNKLSALGYAHRWRNYGKGGHNWWYWSRSLRDLLPLLKRHWAGEAPDTSSFDFRSVQPRYSLYDWSVAITRPAMEFSQFSVRPDGFSLTGSGRAAVVTPPRYAPHSAHRSIVNGTARTITADGNGRLRVTVDLGKANPYQQYTAQGAAWTFAHTGRRDWPAKTVDVSLR